MDKKVAGLIGAMSALVAAVPAQAATSRPLTADAAMEASSYAEPLQPIPNALALLQAATAAPAGPTSTAPVSDGQAMVQEVQYRRHYRRWHHHRRYNRF
jgi:hypothetical protein